MQNGPVAAFKQWPLAKSYCHWLAFIAFLHSSQWQAQAQQHGNKPFSLLLKQLPSPNPLWLQAPQIIGFILGCSAMSGALTYSGAKPVNIGVILGLFCLLPLATMALTLWHGLKNPNAELKGFGTQALFTFLTKHIGLTTPSANLCASGELMPSSATPWLMWRLQLGAASFHIAAMLTFGLVLLFNDIAFGWSSTLIKEPTSVYRFFAVLSLPWQELIGAPSQAFIEQSQFFYSQGINPNEQNINAATNQYWWPHLLFALFFYGLAPRLILCAWLKHKACKAFYYELTNSHHVQRFLQAANATTSHNAKSAGSIINKKTQEHGLDGEGLYEKGSDEEGSDKEDLAEHAFNHPAAGVPTRSNHPPFTLPPNAYLLMWQRELSIQKTLITQGIPCKTLGTQSWQDDKQWLSLQPFNLQPHKQSPGNSAVFVVVHSEQTPTAELSDILALIHTPPQLLLILMGNQIKPAHIKSWQYFAREHQLTLHIASAINH